MPAERASSPANMPTAGSQQAITSVLGGDSHARQQLAAFADAVVLDGAELRRFVGIEEGA